MLGGVGGRGGLLYPSQTVMGESLAAWSTIRNVPNRSIEDIAFVLATGLGEHVHMLLNSYNEMNETCTTTTRER